YLEVTKKLRRNRKTLFISTVKPHKAVGAQTLSHWVKDFLTKAGVDTTQFSAYSAKHAEVSKANARGIDINTIRRTAGWSK
ncbi:GSCOCG00009241001-RA-CDS, partial [Cotesia congregata]